MSLRRGRAGRRGLHPTLTTESFRKGSFRTGIKLIAGITAPPHSGEGCGDTLTSPCPQGKGIELYARSTAILPLAL